MGKITKNARLYTPNSKKCDDDMKEICEFRLSLELPCRRCMYSDNCEKYRKELENNGRSKIH